MQKLWVSVLIALIASKVEGRETAAWLEQPHLEPEMHPEWPLTHVTNISVSPQVPREFERYRLMVSAEYRRQYGKKVLNFSLAATPFTQVPTTHLQCMYANYDSIEKLISVLGRILPRPQLRAVRRILLVGAGEIEIGGHISTMMFSPAILRAIGMSFRPPHV